MANNKQKKTTLWVRVMCVFLAFLMCLSVVAALMNIFYAAGRLSKAFPIAGRLFCVRRFKKIVLQLKFIVFR